MSAILWKTTILLSSRICLGSEFQIENWPNQKQKKFMKKFGDIRSSFAQLMKIATEKLGKEEKMKILEEIKENLADGRKSPMEEIYETSLLPPTDIRKTSIGIILDLIKTERENSENKEENISKLERDFLDSIVWLFTKGKGDVKYVLLVNQILSEFVQKKLNDDPEAHQFVSRLTGAMKLLLDYRDCGENRVAQIAGLVNLAQFFFRCSRVDLYRDYLYKLYDVQLGVNGRLEAANCLAKINETLKFEENAKPFSEDWARKMFPEASTESEVKELLIAETISMMEDAKEFSKAIQLCSELESYYSELEDSAQISDILRIRSGLIARAPQGETAYSFFYLGFWGNGFPKNFQNVQMIARGEELERLEDFQESVVEWFPNAKLILNSDPIPEEVKKGQEQSIQVFPVKPKPFHGDAHGLRQFEHRKKFSKSSGIENASVEEKTFITVDSLPGVSTHVKIGHVTTVTRQPIEVALEAIKSKNEEIKRTVKTILNSNGDNGHLGMLLQGTIDARVNGGLKMYEDAFLGDQSKIPSELQKQLKKVIRDQVPILEKALVLHGKNISSSLLPLHKNLLEMFEKMKLEITAKYGHGETWELPVRRRCLRKIRDPEELSIESSSSSELRKSEQGRSKTRPVSWMESTHNIALSAYSGSEQSLSERGRRRRSKPTEWFSQLLGSQKNLSALDKSQQMVLQENIQNIRPRRPCSLPRSPKLSAERSPKAERNQRMKVKNISLR